MRVSAGCVSASTMGASVERRFKALFMNTFARALNSDARHPFHGQVNSALLMHSASWQEQAPSQEENSETGLASLCNAWHLNQKVWERTASKKLVACTESRVPKSDGRRPVHAVQTAASMRHKSLVTVCNVFQRQWANFSQPAFRVLIMSVASPVKRTCKKVSM
jgi:hypothetical protein